MGKKILYLIAPVFFILLFVCIQVCEKPNFERLNFLQIYLTDNIYAKWQNKLKQIPKDEWQIVDYDTLKNELNFIEQKFVERIFEIKPSEIGFMGPFYSLEKPQNLVKIPAFTLPEAEDGKTLPAKYCPEHSYADFIRMTDSMYSEIGKRVYINSGYRSPGRQAYGFFDDLVMERNDYSLLKTAKWVAMPGYSEHNSGVNNAIDVINGEGISGEDPGQVAEDFEILPEYEWLTKNASKFNFYLTYPRGNNLGVQFEPWHWHWEKKN